MAIAACVYFVLSLIIIYSNMNIAIFARQESLSQGSESSAAPTAGPFHAAAGSVCDFYFERYTL
jgi:hypothetical protein